MTTMRLMIVAVMAVALAGCAGAAGDATVVGDQPTSGAVAGMCAEGSTDCVDTPQLNSDEPVPVDETGIKQFRKDAKYYLGKPESELTDLIRIGRRGDEQFALTEDYRVGRITVELDEVDGEMIVTSSTVELPDGPETFKLDQ